VDWALEIATHRVMLEPSFNLEKTISKLGMAAEVSSTATTIGTKVGGLKVGVHISRPHKSAPLRREEPRPSGRSYSAQ